MMKTIFKYILIIVSFILANTALAQEKGDAVFNKVIHEYTLNDDGSSEYREYKEVKLLSHMAFHRLYGESFIIYDPHFQEVEIIQAYTVMADGKRVEVPDNAFNEVLPRTAAHSATYNHLREMVVTHTGLEVGAIIYLEYKIKTKPGYMPAFMGEEIIKDIVPVREKQIIINIPSGQELHYKMLNLRTGPEIKQGKGVNTYTFLFRELSASTREWGTDHESLPRLFFSTAKDLERAYFPFVAQRAFTYQVSPEMEEKVARIREANEGDLEVALAIQKMVVNEIGTWNLPLKYTGFKCRTPEQVWKSNAGIGLEKNVLLASLLLKAGISAIPVAIIPEKYYDRKVGSLYMFKNFAVRIKTEDWKEIYLSATEVRNQDMAYSLQGNKMLILDGAIESIRTFDPIKIKTEIIYNGKLLNDENEKIKGVVSVKLVGSANPFFALMHDTAYAKKYAKGVQDVTLKRLNINESQFELEVVQTNVFQQYGDYIFMELPESGKGISSWGFTYIETGRQNSIKLRELINEKYGFSIELPDGYKLLSPAVTIQIENSIGKVLIILEQDGNIINVTRAIELNQQVIKYHEFDAFNELWKAWMNPNLKEIIFKKRS